MKPENRFWWFAAISITITIAILVAILVIFVRHLTPEELRVLTVIIKKHAGYLFGALILVIAALGFALDAIFHNYIIPINKMAEETLLIHSVNPSRRIRTEGSKDVVLLASAINESADLYEDLRNTLEERIDEARADAEEEKNIMATFMSELPQGVLICNAEGGILLYNKRAKAFFSGENYSETDGNSEGKIVGLGRSVFDVIDKPLIMHSLNDIAAKLRLKKPNVESSFVLVGKEKKTLKVEVVPILNHFREFTGFLLVIFDITRQIETDSHVDFLLQSLIRDIRSSLAGIRSAIEAIREYPEMGAAQITIFNDIIHKETLFLSEGLDRTADEYSEHVKTHWPLMPVTSKDLLEIIAAKALERLEIHIGCRAETDEWVRVDAYSLVLGILFLLNRLADEVGTRHFDCEIERKGRFVNMDFFWQGGPLMIETLRRWKNQPAMIESEGIPLTVREVAGHHHAEIWSFSCRKTGLPCLRIALPATEKSLKETIRDITILPRSRLEFYDFDLFNQPGQVPEVDNRLLTELTCTVFDTETTGLDPYQDEIISIAAVRIVNGNLLREEIFDQLIDPGRDIPEQSTEIHGITSEMVAGCPSVEKALSLFRQFVGDTVLVAHNAAFDMRMLEVKEKTTGISFINPVLDTLLLSAVAQPSRKRHSIESLGERLGINIVGRHSALGDALAAGEMFLKLIPLLNQKGIFTLKEARAASRKTYYSKLKY